MPLVTEWVTDSSVSNAVVSIQHHTSTPLNGNRSVRFNVTTGGTSGTYGSGAIFLVTPTYTRGFVLGRLQTLMRVDSNTTNAGIYFMASQATGITGAGNAYTCGVNLTNNTIELRKLNAGLSDATPTILHTSGTVVGTAPTSTFALEVEWKADLGIFGGTHITCRYGATIATLATIFVYVDESSPYLVSSAEGLFLTRSGITTVGQVVYDDTSVFQLTAT
jgi:hypothetical protein